MALTARWRRATLAEDKVVRPINLARTTGALAVGQWHHNDCVCTASWILWGSQLKRKTQVYWEWPLTQAVEHTFTLCAVASGCSFFGVSFCHQRRISNCIKA